MIPIGRAPGESPCVASSFGGGVDPLRAGASTLAGVVGEVVDIGLEPSLAGADVILR